MRTRMSKDVFVTDSPVIFQVKLLNSDYYLSGIERNDYISSYAIRAAITRSADKLEGVGLVYHKGDDIVFVLFPPGKEESFFWTSNSLNEVVNSLSRWMIDGMIEAWNSSSIAELCVKNDIPLTWVEEMRNRVPKFSITPMVVNEESEEEEIEFIADVLRDVQRNDQRNILLTWAENYVPNAKEFFDGKRNKEIVEEILALDETSRQTKPHPHRLLGRMIHQAEVIRSLRHANGETKESVSLRWVVDERTPIGVELSGYVAAAYHNFYGEDDAEEEAEVIEVAIA